MTYEQHVNAPVVSSYDENFAAVMTYGKGATGPPPYAIFASNQAIGQDYDAQQARQTFEGYVEPPKKTRALRWVIWGALSCIVLVILITILILLLVVVFRPKGPHATTESPDGSNRPGGQGSGSGGSGSGGSGYGGSSSGGSGYGGSSSGGSGYGGSGSGGSGSGMFGPTGSPPTGSPPTGSPPTGSPPPRGNGTRPQRPRP